MSTVHNSSHDNNANFDINDLPQAVNPGIRRGIQRIPSPLQKDLHIRTTQSQPCGPVLGWILLLQQTNNRPPLKLRI
jgi:hypothetical protein